MSRCKVFGTVIPKVEIEEITVFPSIGEASSKSLMAFINTLHNIISILRGIYRFVLRIFKYCSNNVVSKGTVIMQFGF